MLVYVTKCNHLPRQEARRPGKLCPCPSLRRPHQEPEESDISEDGEINGDGGISGVTQARRRQMRAPSGEIHYRLL